MKITEIKDLMLKIEAKKNAIAKERDELREIYDEIGELLEYFDAGVEGLDSGIREICDAVDSISCVV